MHILMGNYNTMVLFYFIFFIVSALMGISRGEEMVTALFVFGDSLVDVGNNNYLKFSTTKSNFPHNGIDFPTNKPTGRFCNGKNSADFIAEKVNLPSSTPYFSLRKKGLRNGGWPATGVSFASGGAGILNGSDQLLGRSIPLSRQVDYYTSVHEEIFNTLGSSAAQIYFSKSIFTVVIGSNDLIDYIGSSSLQKKKTPQQYLDVMIIKLNEQLKRLYDNGARKFLVTGVGCIGCIPMQRVKIPTHECNQKLNSLAVQYNSRLKPMLETFNSKFNDTSYSYVDTYHFLLNVINNPAASGFSEVKAACCGLGDLRAKIPCVPIATYCSNRRDHIWWDLYHPTEAAVRMLVNTLFNGSSNYTYPINLQQLIAV